MYWQAAGLRRLDRFIWTIIAAVVIAVLAVTWTAGFHFLWISFASPGAVAVVVLIGQRFYQIHRPDERIATALGGTAQLLVFAMAGAPLSYIGASLNLPLQDRWLDAADHAMGLDWFSWLSWMDSHVSIHPLFFLSYFSLMPQIAIAVLALSFRGHVAWLRTYMLAFLITTIVTIGIAAIIPSEGVWGFHKLNQAAYPHIMPAVHGTYLPIFHGLRDGSYRLLVGNGSEGIITFPSLHAALGLLLTAAFWPISKLRWIIFALNSVMIVSIPVDGGHYFIDILAGLAIAGSSFAVAHIVSTRAQKSLQTETGTNPGLGKI